MMRRRRPTPRETPFSLDSFLDLVTNVVGIIIRLIIVAWIGGRAYNSVPEALKRMPGRPQVAATGASGPGSTRAPVALDREGAGDPLEQELARQRQELAQAEARLVEQLRQHELLQHNCQQVETQLGELTLKRQRLDDLQADGVKAGARVSQAGRDLALVLADLQSRRRQLELQLLELEKQPAPRQVLRYRTPVSATVHGEQTYFECREGRVAYINMSALLPQVLRTMRSKEELLRNQWQIEEVTEPVGAFRLRYVIERQKSGLDSVLGTASPEAYSSFSYGLAVWQADPVAPRRGEHAEAALAEGAEFRQVVDGLPPDAAVTFFVYSDSFPLYRKLRDYLGDRLTVAAHPLPPGTPITWSSSRGWLARGQ